MSRDTQGLLLAHPACWWQELCLKVSCLMDFHITRFLWETYLETSSEGADLGLEVSLISVRKTMFMERFFLITTWLFSVHQNILELQAPSSVQRNPCRWVVLKSWASLLCSSEREKQERGEMLVCSQLSNAHLENIYNTAQFQPRWLRTEAGIPESPLQVALVTWNLWSHLWEQSSAPHSIQWTHKGCLCDKAQDENTGARNEAGPTAG